MITKKGNSVSISFIEINAKEKIKRLIKNIGVVNTIILISLFILIIYWVVRSIL